jgi:hypothetical protein
MIFMNNVKQFKKYYHGMNVNPLRPNCCQQHYIFISWENEVPWKQIIIDKTPLSSMIVDCLEKFD